MFGRNLMSCILSSFFLRVRLARTFSAGSRSLFAMADKADKKDDKDKKGGGDDNLSKMKQESAFRNWIQADGEFPPEAGRYHLYVSLACPWAHRTIITRSLKGLEDAISMTVVDWALDRKTGWSFNPDRPGCDADDENHKKLLREIYEMAKPGYDGRITVPVLWDKKKKTVVNNESAEVMRMFETQFNKFCKTDEQKELELYPANLWKQIDETNEWVQTHVNQGVYKCGFSKKQADYSGFVKPLFQHLDKAEKILSNSRYITGSKLTEADIRLFTTCLRFDTVYHVLFKCNKKRITDYPNLWGWLRELYQKKEINKTINFDHIANHYYTTMTDINPDAIVPIGPDLDFDAPHDRNTK